MNLETRMRQSIKKRSGALILRSDVAALGSPTQVSHVLDLLIKKEVLTRLGRGLYLKKASADTPATPQPTMSLTTIIREAVRKLGLTLHSDIPAESSTTTTHADILIEVENPRVDRKMHINGKVIHLRSYRKPKTNIDDAIELALPTTGIADYVAALAKKYQVNYASNQMDEWAKAVTILAGDEVNPDKTEDLIVALKRAGKLSQKEVALLTINHLRERN